MSSSRAERPLVNVAVMGVVACLAASCATTQPAAQTIEPPSGGGASQEAAAAPAAPREGAGRDADRGGGGNSEGFVLSREGGAKVATEEPIHINDSWWRFRANFLKMSESQARARDAEISSRQASTDFWDPQTAIETVSIWTGLCNQCHGGRRRQQDAISMPAPPANWGQGEGIFFGNRRQYSEVFAMVYNGGPKREGKPAMPAWRNILAKEEIWALLYFLEYQSGGIEGRFPPSLYPRMRTDVGGK